MRQKIVSLYRIYLLGFLKYSNVNFDLGTYLVVGLLIPLQDLCFNTRGNFVDTSPLILVLRTSSDYKEALKNVDDVVDAPSFHTQFLCAAVKKKHALALDAVVVEESAAKFTQ